MLNILISHELPIERFALSELIRSVLTATSINIAEGLPLPSEVEQADLWVCSYGLLEQLNSDELASLVGTETAKKLCIYGQSNNASLLKFIHGSKIPVIHPRFHVRLFCEVIGNLLGINVNEVSPSRKVLALTPMQNEVMRLKTQNLTIREIARELNLRPSMVISYLDTSIYRLGCNSIEQAIAVFQASHPKSMQSQ